MTIRITIRTGLASTALAAVCAVLGALPAHAADMHGRTRSEPQVRQQVRQQVPGAPQLDRHMATYTDTRMSGRHGDERMDGRHDLHARWGGRGHPTAVRPHHPHHPPRHVVVVPPCKRGGPGITPC